MYTTTAKTVLTPLAESVSHLILIISASELEHSPLPDLTELAKVVSHQILNLVGIGKKISLQDSADIALRQGMPVACGEVTVASQLLVSGSDDLIVDPTSSEGKAKLLKAASGILSGTTAVLNAFDDFEVRKIVNASQAVQQKIKLILEDTTIADPNAIIAIVKGLHALIGSLAQLTTKRLGELLSVNHQNQLRSAVATIVREGPVQIGALKVIIMNRKSTAGFKARELSCGRINTACEEITSVLLMRGEAPFTELFPLGKKSLPMHIKQLEERKNRVLNGVNSVDIDPKVLRVAMQSYSAQSNVIIQDAEVNSLSLTRSETSASLLKKKLATITAKLITDPSEHASKSTTIDTLTSASHALRRFNQEIDNEILADFMDGLNAISDSRAEYTAFGAAIKLAEQGALTQQGKDRFFAACEDIIVLMGHLSDRIAPGNENTANEVMLWKVRILALLPGVITAIDARNGDKDDAASKELLTTIVQMWETDVKDMHNVVYNAFDGLVIVVGTELAASRLLKKLGRLDSSDKANEALGNLTKLKGQYALYLGKEIENTSDANYKRVLQDNLMRLEEAIPFHLTELQTIINDSGFDQSRLIHAVRGLNDVLSTIGSSLRRPGQEVATPLPTLPRSLRLPKDILTITVGVEDLDMLASPTSPLPFQSIDALEPIFEIPMLFTKEEQIAAPIAAAAREIIVESSRWLEKGNSLITEVNSIAGKITLLSYFHNELKKESSPANKSGFITASRDIIFQVNSLVEHARNLAARCTDARLRKQLVNTLDQITSISSQLRIVAAVKAASPNDTDKDQQLITCAQNLVKAVKTCIKECETCSLRQALVNVEAEMEVKSLFKRTIYRENAGKSA